MRRVSGWEETNAALLDADSRAHPAPELGRAIDRQRRASHHIQANVVSLASNSGRMTRAVKNGRLYQLNACPGLYLATAAARAMIPILSSTPALWFSDLACTCFIRLCASSCEITSGKLRVVFHERSMPTGP